MRQMFRLSRTALSDLDLIARWIAHRDTPATCAACVAVSRFSGASLMARNCARYTPKSKPHGGAGSCLTRRRHSLIGHHRNNPLWPRLRAVTPIANAAHLVGPCFPMVSR